jgi:hypothetical protein
MIAQYSPMLSVGRLLGSTLSRDSGPQMRHRTTARVAQASEPVRGCQVRSARVAVRQTAIPQRSRRGRRSGRRLRDSLWLWRIHVVWCSALLHAAIGASISLCRRCSASVATAWRLRITSRRAQGRGHGPRLADVCRAGHRRRCALLCHRVPLVRLQARTAFPHVALVVPVLSRERDSSAFEPFRHLPRPCRAPALDLVRHRRGPTPRHGPTDRELQRAGESVMRRRVIQGDHFWWKASWRLCSTSSIYLCSCCNCRGE